MRVRMLAMSVFILVGTMLSVDASFAQLECIEPRGFEVEDIKIYSSVNSLEDGVIVQVEVSNQFDSSIDAMARYPYRASVLALDEHNTAVLYPSFVIPNQRYTTVKVSVVAVPKEATTESLNLIFSAFDVIVGMAADAALKGKPLLKILTGYIAGNISDEALSVLQRGRIVGTGSIEAPTLSMLGFIPSDDFELRVRAICR